MLLPDGRGPTYTGRIHRHESAFFLLRSFFPSPLAPVGWVSGMIFFPNFVSKPATTIEPNWACLFFFLQKCRWV
jgi:hypothetical protein